MLAVGSREFVGARPPQAARDLEISHPTAVSYLDWLQTVFLLYEIPAWSRNLWSKAARRPKFHLTDTGPAARLLGLGPDALASPTSPQLGRFSNRSGARAYPCAVVAHLSAPTTPRGPTQNVSGITI